MDCNVFLKEFTGAVIVCDKNGIIVYMNDAGAKVNEKFGGMNLIGKNLLDCHSEKSREKIRHIMQTQEQNMYTIEKKGKKKIILQTPWYTNGEYQGLMEVTFEIPFTMPHFVRS